MNIVFPDYNNSIMNITATVLKYYGVQSDKESIIELEEELKKGYKNVVYFLIDAMGSEILKKHLDKTKYLIENQVRTLTTVFPSTTVSATISALTGNTPINNGWIGWIQYIKEEDKSVIFFYNKDFYDDTIVFNYNVSDKYVPVKKIYKKINESNPNIITHEVFPEFREENHKTIKDMADSIIKKLNTEGNHFVYAYWDKLDTYLHKYGTESEVVHEHIESVTNDLKYLSEELGEDTLIIVTADHGQIDVEEIPLWEYGKIVETFRNNPAIEARATAFYIKEGMEEQFVREFNDNFKDYYILYKSEDLLKTKIFGGDEPHPRSKEFLGDYFAIAIDKYSFKLANSKRVFKAQHAGLTKDEMLVPMILLSQKK